MKKKKEWDTFNPKPYKYKYLIYKSSLSGKEADPHNIRNFSFKLYRLDTGEEIEDAVDVKPDKSKDNRYVCLKIMFNTNSHKIFGRKSCKKRTRNDKEEDVQDLLSHNKFFQLTISYNNNLLISSGKIQLVARRDKTCNSFDKDNYGKDKSCVPKRPYNKNNKQKKAKHQSPIVHDEEENDGGELYEELQEQKYQESPTDSSEEENDGQLLPYEEQLQVSARIQQNQKKGSYQEVDEFLSNEIRPDY